MDEPLPQSPYTVQHLADAYRILTAIDVHNSRYEKVGIQEWYKSYFANPLGKGLPKVSRPRYLQLQKWALDVLSSHKSSCVPPPSRQTEAPKCEVEAVEAALPQFYFRMLNEPAYFRQELKDAHFLIDIVNELSGVTLSGKEKISYIILEEPSSSHPHSGAASAAYAGIASSNIRGDDHSEGIRNQDSSNFKQNPAMYSALRESLDGGRSIYWLNVLPDHHFSKQAAYTVEMLLIAFFRYLPQNKNIQHGSSTNASNSLLDAMDELTKAKYGCALFLDRIQKIDSFTPPLLKAEAIDPQAMIPPLILRVKPTESIHRPVSASGGQKRRSTSDEDAQAQAKKLKMKEGDGKHHCNYEVRNQLWFL